MAGFVVLVAVIAVQHFAGGGPPGAAGSSSAPVTPSPSGVDSASGVPATPSPSRVDSVSGAGSSAATDAAPDESSPTTAPQRIAGNDRGTVLVTTPRIPHRGPPPSSSTVDTTSPSTSTARKKLLPGAGNWELVGYGSGGLVRYRPATGRVVVTPVAALLGDNGAELSFVVTGSTAIIRPMQAVPGYLVTDGQPADALTGPLATGQADVLPGPDPKHVWMALAGDGAHSVALLDASGKRTGTIMKLPAAAAQVGYSLTPDGDGYVLAEGIGGVYDVRPDGATLVTHGMVLAAGPTEFLIYECDDNAHCATAAVDRKTGKRRAIPSYTPTQSFAPRGVISSDGRYAALVDLGSGGAAVKLIDLRSGTIHTPVVFNSFAADDTSTMLVISPDNRYLLVAAGNAVVPVDTHTGKLLHPLPLPQVKAIAIRPAG